MSTIAFVPVRKGSKSIPLKNIKLFCGKPLVYWCLLALQNSKVDKIVLATDSNEISKKVKSFNFSKISIYNRETKNASDNSTTESVMLEYINNTNLSEDTFFILVQATSPFTLSNHFNEALDLMSKYDSVLSCCQLKKFFWNHNGEAINYNINERPRRQEFKGCLVENGAFYISTIKQIKSNLNRISGKIGLYKMPEYTSIEIDEKSDWIIAENLMNEFVLSDISKKTTPISLVLSDVDGVLTDAGMYYTENGDEIKKFSAYDGMGFKILKEKGLKVGIITTEDRSLNMRRAQKLNLDFHIHGAKDKLRIVKDLCAKENISLQEVAYIGDDINCYDLLSNVGYAACPNNAVKKIKNISGIIKLNKSGGDGVFREFTDYLLDRLYIC